MSNVTMVLPAVRALSKDNRELASSMMKIMALMKVKSLESKKKQLRNSNILKQDISKFENASNFLLSLDDPDTVEEINKQKQMLLSLNRDIDQSEKQICLLQLKVKEAESELEGIRQQQINLENKLYPRARYAVNLLREVGKVTWQMGQSPHQVKGFIRGKCSVKAFCFDVQKQSHFFITNSLWEMGEEDIW